MTTERDDPEGQTRPGRRPQDVKGRLLCNWAVRVTGASLIRDGIPPAAVEGIVYDAYAQYARFRKSVRNPRLLLVKRVLARAESYRKLRGIPAPEHLRAPAPDLLDLIQMQVGMESLPENARRALELLFEGSGKTLADVAVELDVTVVYVETLVENALEALRKWGSQQWPEEPW